MAFIDKSIHLASDSRALRLYNFTTQASYVDFLTTSAGGLTITPTVAAQTVTLANTATLTVAGAFVAIGTTPATAGVIRVPNNQDINFRNATNTLDQRLIGSGSSNEVKVGGSNSAWVELPAKDVFINDTSNANMTVGLTINQGANDNEILTFKSSDVAHTATSLTEADTFGFVQKANANQGGLHVVGIRDVGNRGVLLEGLDVTSDTTKSTAGVGSVSLRGSLVSGGTRGSHGADANLVSIENNGTTRFIFDAEGSAHADIEWTTFDRFTDLAVVEDMETLLAPGQVRRRFGEVVRHDRAFFEREGLLHDVREVGPGKMRGMLNITKAHMLAFGAIRQVGGRQGALEAAFRYLLANPSDGAGALALLEA
jgi:hypothetical protein